MENEKVEEEKPEKPKFDMPRRVDAPKFAIDLFGLGIRLAEGVARKHNPPRADGGTRHVR